MYLFYDEETAISVDSFDADAIEHALACTFDKQLYTSREIKSLQPAMPARRLTHVLTTHSHADHAGGDPQMRHLFPSARFLSHSSLSHLSVTETPLCSIRALFTPSHTRCSVSYLLDSSYLLTGDFLFKLGCGCFFEGDGSDFVRSVSVVYENCPDDVILLYGHDYYEANRRFASQFYLVDDKRLDEEYFLTLADEKQFNPFLNYRATGVEGGTPAKIVQRLRDMKDALMNGQ